jgi:hypothetical protein
MQETNGNSRDPGIRVAKTSEDRYIRSNSSSSLSSIDEPITSPKSNIYNPSTINPQLGKPDHNRVYISFFFLYLNFFAFYMNFVI